MPNGKHSVIYVIREIVVLQCLPVFRCFLNTIRLLQKNLNCTNLHELRAYIYALGVTHLYFLYFEKLFGRFYGPVWDLQHSQCFGEIVGPS